MCLGVQAENNAQHDREAAQLCRPYPGGEEVGFGPSAGRCELCLSLGIPLAAQTGASESGGGAEGPDRRRSWQPGEMCGAWTGAVQALLLSEPWARIPGRLLLLCKYLKDVIRANTGKYTLSYTHTHAHTHPYDHRTTGKVLSQNSALLGVRFWLLLSSAWSCPHPGCPGVS